MQRLNEAIQELVAFTLKPTQEISSFYVDSLLNWYGQALCGSHQQIVECAVDFYCKEAPRQSKKPALIGRQERVTIPSAVMLNCLSSSAFAYDDIHFSTTIHPAGPIAAAIFGVAASQKVSGADALDAFRIGMEVECRLGNMILGKGTGASKGWYATGITGGIGAAAACGRLYAFDKKSMESALGLASGLACGNRGLHGAMAGLWIPAVAAEAGYTAAGLSKSGFTASIQGLSGENGLIRLLAPEPNINAVVDGLGEYYVCEDTSCKPYPYGFVATAVIASCLELRKKIQAEHLSLLDRIELQVSPISAKLGNTPVPTDMYHAQVNLPYISSCVLADPKLAYTPVPEDFYIPENINALMKLVHVKENTSLDSEQAICTLFLRDGTSISERCTAAPGSPGRPLSSHEIRDKFLRIVSSLYCDQETASRLLTSLTEIEKMEDISDLLSFSLPT